MTASILKSSLPLSWVPFVLAVLIIPWSGGCSREEPRPSHEEIVATEFEAILDLHDQVCGGVTNFEKVDDLAYEVTCTSGEVYIINVSHEGHVDVATHTP